MSETAIENNPTETPQVDAVADYWGVDETHKWYFPDGVQYIEFNIMTEGDRAKFQKLTNQDVTLTRDNTARVRMDPATERQSLIKSSVIGWHLFRGGKPVGFHASKLEEWLSKADPKLVDDLEFAIRMANPWMQQEQKVEDIDKELDRLHELRRAAVERESGEASSANK